VKNKAKKKRRRNIDGNSDLVLKEGDYEEGENLMRESQE
jgi:hypothetical protein